MPAEAAVFDLDDPFAIAEHRAECLREAELHVRRTLAMDGIPAPLIDAAVARVLACAAEHYDQRLRELSDMLEVRH